MIRLTRCTQASKAGTYFRLHLETGDSQIQPVPAATVKMRAFWVGSALKDLHLNGLDQPTASQLVRLGRGLDPSEKKRLAPSKNRKRAYYDLTIAAPKTISLAALLAPDHITAQSVISSHQNAMAAVCRAVGGMMHGRTKTAPKVEKWLGAVFCHTHTREGDPHLHGHVVIPNIGKNALGDWRAVKIDISGVRRSRLELIYAHELAGSLRNYGLGHEIVMRPSGQPELKSLLPLAKHFAHAGEAVHAAAKQTLGRFEIEGRQPTITELHPRSKLPLRADRFQIQVRQKIADEIRKPKPKDADNPAMLKEEGIRWRRTLTTMENKTLMAVLDGADFTNPNRVKQLPALLPPISEIIRRAFLGIKRGVPITPPVFFKAVIVEAAGQHSMEDLHAALKVRIERRKKNLARMRAQYEADSIAIAQAHYAEIEAANEARARAGQAVRGLAGPVDPTPAPDAVASPQEAVAAPQDVEPVETPETVTPVVTRARGQSR